MSYISLGFTGTRQGMSPRQLQALNVLLRNIPKYQFHHGDCLGADDEAHTLALIELNDDNPNETIVIHPPTDKKYCANHEATVHITMRLAKPYLERNRDIVNSCDLLIAAPNSLDEPDNPRGSGTWFTIRYARANIVPVIILDR